MHCFMQVDLLSKKHTLFTNSLHEKNKKHLGKNP